MYNKMSLMDYLNMQVKIANMEGITKQRFGEYLHDPDNTDEEKLAFLDKVAMMGGYDELADD